MRKISAYSIIIISIILLITACETQTSTAAPPPTEAEIQAAYSRYKEVEPEAASVPDDFIETYKELAQDKDTVKIFWSIASYRLISGKTQLEGEITYEMEERVKSYLPIEAENVKLVSEPDAADYIIEVNIINTYQKNTGVAVISYKYTYSLIERETKIIHAEETFVTTFAKKIDEPESRKLIQYGWK
jgi:hypothetical protein